MVIVIHWKPWERHQDELQNLSGGSWDRFNPWIFLDWCSEVAGSCNILARCQTHWDPKLCCCFCSHPEVSIRNTGLMLPYATLMDWWSDWCWCKDYVAVDLLKNCLNALSPSLCFTNAVSQAAGQPVLSSPWESLGSGIWEEPCQNPSLSCDFGTWKHCMVLTLNSNFLSCGNKNIAGPFQRDPSMR